MTRQSSSPIVDSMPNSPFNATLLKRVDLNDELAVFHVKPDTGPIPSFEPGQFATLGLLPGPEDDPPVNPDSPSAKRKGPRLIRRAYSIASPPSQTDHMAFYIVRVDEGKLTPKLWRLEPGDPIFLGEKIAGKFTLTPVPEGKDLVMIGTGTGLAPYLSMYHQYRGTGRWRKFILIEGCRLARDLGYLRELEQTAQQNEDFIYLPTVTREPDDAPWPGLRGRVNTAIEPERYQELVGTPLTPEHCHVFLCGNPQMIDQCEANLIERGFVTEDRKHPEGNIHLERYW